MARPTEEEIRKAIDARMDEESSGQVPGALRDQVRGLIDDASDPLTWPCTFVLDGLVADQYDDPDETVGMSALYRDLRLSEASALRALMDAASARAADRCEAIILDELTAAGVAFAQVHPDAPRPTVAA